jgi:hypothetical protein
MFVPFILISREWQKYPSKLQLFKCHFCDQHMRFSHKHLILYLVSKIISDLFRCVLETCSIHEIWGFHGGENLYCCLEPATHCRLLLTKVSEETCCLHVILWRRERRFLRISYNHLTDYIVSQPSIPQSKYITHYYYYYYYKTATKGLRKYNIWIF